MPDYLKRRGNKFHFQKRIPTIYRHLFEKDFIQVSLKTGCEDEAHQRAQNFNLILKDFWKSLTGEKEELEIRTRLENAVEQAQKYGFQYRPKEEVIEKSSLAEFVNRINAASSTKDESVKKSILGNVPVSITLSEALEEYFEHELGNLASKSENQIRKWKNPRKKAVRNFIQVVGNKALADITRQDAMDFRSWWVDRISSESLSPNSANKDFTYTKKVLKLAVNNHSLSIDPDAIFKEIALKNVEKTRRYPFPTTYIQGTLFSIDGIHEEIRLLLYAMADTGARISELVGLKEEEILLDEEIPYISIQPNEIRTLKTPQSERKIPLVGAAFYAFQELGGKFRHYFNKPDLISSAGNKYLRENELLPSENHSIYSLRHSFEDRLTAVEPPDKVQAALMGHKYARPRYGDGPSLEQKRFWLEKIAFKIMT